jgi:branched-chain amino acid aminotransferase
MGRRVVIDGTAFGPEEARVSVYDRGFLYGDAVFETVRTYARRLFALDEHLRRLERSAAALAIELPVARAVLAAECERAVAEAGEGEHYVRVMVTRGSGPLGLDPALALRAMRVVIVEPVAPLPVAQYRDGIRARCVQTVRASDAAHSAKLSNYLASVLALGEARKAGADEALVVNRDGLLVEGTTANVFVVRAGAVVTPPVEAGLLPGITRAIVLDLCAREGVLASERTLWPEQLQDADEMFITSSLRELLPVVEVDGRAVGSGRPGPVTRTLHRAFRRHVGLDGPMPWEIA